MLFLAENTEHFQRNIRREPGLDTCQNWERFPQYLFAHEITSENFEAYSREPFDQRIYKVLDDAEARLSKSTIYDGSVSRRVFLTNSHGLYAFLSNKAFRSFANSVSLINNILINKSEVADDLVLLNRPKHNKRSLNGVIAHEVAHLFIRKKVGVARTLLTPFSIWPAGRTNILFFERQK